MDFSLTRMIPDFVQYFLCKSFMPVINFDVQVNWNTWQYSCFHLAHARQAKDVHLLWRCLNHRKIHRKGSASKIIVLAS
jgi:hypothetical protein